MKLITKLNVVSERGSSVCISTATNFKIKNYLMMSKLNKLTLLVREEINMRN